MTTTTTPSAQVRSIFDHLALHQLREAKTNLLALGRQVPREASGAFNKLLDNRTPSALRLAAGLVGSVVEGRGPNGYSRGVNPSLVTLPDTSLKLDKHLEWGQAIFDEAAEVNSSFQNWLQDSIFEAMMSNEDFKKQMIAFIDVVATAHEKDIPRYIAQYFPTDSLPDGNPLSWALKLAQSPIAPNYLVRKAVIKGLKDMGQRFLAGNSIEEAIQNAGKLHAEKDLMSSLDVVTENVTSAEEADRYVEKVIGLIEEWSRKPVKDNNGQVSVRHISIKLSALTHLFNPAYGSFAHNDVRARLLKIFQKAKEHDVLVNVDLEERYVRTLSYQSFWDALTDPSLDGWDNAGVVVQGYMKDSCAVLSQMISTAATKNKKIQIRLVKGAYQNYEQIVSHANGWDVPVFTNQQETDANYETLMRLAFANTDKVRVAVASHNAYDIAKAIALREAMGLSIDVIEHQLLLGVGNQLASALRALGIPVRMYSPFGDRREAIAYMVRRLVEVVKSSAIGMTKIAGSYRDYFEKMSARQGAPEVEKPKNEFDNTPAEDWSDRENEAHILKAIEERKKSIPVIKPIIGEDEENGRGEKRKFSNPANLDDIVAEVQDANTVQVERTIREAQQGFTEWSAKDQEERSRILEKAADIIHDRRFELAAKIMAQTGKPYYLAMAEVEEAIDFLKRYAKTGRDFHNERNSIGVVAAIGPFNFPFSIPVGEVVGALTFGNAVIFKPSPQTAMIGREVVTILREAGVPASALQFLPGGKDVGEQLVNSPDIDGIAFTGSKETADHIIKAAGLSGSTRNGQKVVVAETGGKNAIIVDKSADLDLAVKAILLGAFEFAGQRCSAVSRLIVHEDIKEALLVRLRAGIQNMLIGDVSDTKASGVQVSPVIDPAAKSKIEGYIARGKANGLKISQAKIAPGLKGYFIPPTIFENVQPKHQLAQEEIFGPVLSVESFEDFGYGLEIFNSTNYGLTGGLISRDLGNIARFKEEARAGNLYINRGITGAMVGRQPFGGLKSSGTGPKTGWDDYPLAFTRGKKSARQTNSEKLKASIRDMLSLMGETDLSKSPTKNRLNFLRTLLTNTDETIRSKLNSILNAAEHLLSKQHTQNVPGETDEVIYDQPLGKVYIEQGASDEDLLCSLFAAWAMGNKVVLSTRYKETLASLGWPTENTVIFFADNLTDINSIVDFKNKHTKSYIGDNAFMRFITSNWKPSEMDSNDKVVRHFVARFANPRVITTNILRHGANLDVSFLSDPTRRPYRNRRTPQLLEKNT